MLGVSPNTLRSWERRFGYPTPRRTSGGHRQFDLAEIEALRQAFEETHNVSSAISIARERGSGPSSPVRLRSALRRFEELEADRILEESLAVRSVERTVEEVLLAAVDGLAAREGDARSAELVFGLRWATGWLAAAKRVAPPPMRPEAVLIFDASWTCDLDSLHAQALELCLRRAGLRTLMLTPDLDASRLAHVMRVLHPRVIVLTGKRTAWAASLSRIALESRRTSEAVDVLEFRGALAGADATAVPRLGASAIGGRDVLLARLNGVGGAPARGRPALAQIS
ncbi:MAG: MerR family transcriptional regulator, light-induced transcriptional regulator [Solirubrobacteraceae bacterium]|nr:MerR family transcriptional regulator, light-induced transcriptional regulator [Solirubrobacteraceae bacterium]